MPTPKWNENICDKEWCFLTEHTRRVEWANIFKNNENTQNEECLPTKLIIPKFSRPPSESLTEEVATYKKLVETKLRNLGPKVEKQYLHNNNLPFRLKLALKTIKMLISEQKVVVCRTDKDGKILVVNYSDYHEIMEKELNKFDVLQFTPQIMHKQFEVDKRKCEILIISLFEKGVISKDLLYYSTGYRVKENCYQKATGELAKFFACTSPAYAYPFFKTHKLQPDHLLNVQITDIPIKLLQSVGHIPSSRFTAMIEYIFHPIAVKYCQDGINEYCRDSTHHLLELDQWKSNNLNIQNKLINKDLFIVAADVIALYPNINRNTLRDALTTALNLQSQFCALGQKYFVELIMLTLESVIIQHGQNFYKQSNAIITGDNHLVSLANIAMHFAITRAFPTLKKAVIYKRFIDDIFLLLLGKTQPKI